MKRFFLLLITFVLLQNFLLAQYDPLKDYTKGYTNTITTAVPFLMIAPDSRSGAMGDIGVATSADATSQHHNPSKYVFNKNIFGISFSYSPWLSQLTTDVNLLYMSGYYKATRMDAIGFALRYFGLGEIQFTDEYGNITSIQKPNEFAIDFTYSRKLADVLSMAITPRFIYSDLTARQIVGGMESSAGLAVAADLSIFYEQDFKYTGIHNSTLRFGLNISNMGNKIKYSNYNGQRDFIPTNLKLGLGYAVELDEYNSLALSFDLNKLLVPTKPIYYTDSIAPDGKRAIAKGKDPDVSPPQGMIQSFYDAPGGFKEEMRELNFGIGLEYVYRNLLFVRAGYFYENKWKGGRQYLTCGAGIKYSIIGIDMSYLFTTTGTHHPLENTLRFTLTFDLVSFEKDDIKKQGKLK